MNEQELKSFGAIITKVMSRGDLSREESRHMFSEILFGSQPDLQKGAFMAALRMKGETADEIAGCFEAIYKLDTNKVEMPGEVLIENCGTGMDTLKTFNVSTLASIVAASLGVKLARHGARAITSRCGTVDLCETLGVDVECDVETVRRSIEISGIGLFNGMSAQVHPSGLGRILSQIRFGTTLNIAASLANPALPRLAVRGVGAADQIKPTLDVMEKIGYRKAILCHGWDEGGTKGMDELSTLGHSAVGVLEEDGNRRFLEITPEEAGLRRGRYDDMRPRETVQEEALEAVRLLAGRGNSSRTDIVALNTGAILWLSGGADTLREGTEQALGQILRGAPIEKLRQWVITQNRSADSGLAALSALAAKSNVPL